MADSLKGLKLPAASYGESSTSRVLSVCFGLARSPRSKLRGMRPLFRFKPFSAPVEITETMFLESRMPASLVMDTFKGAVVIKLDTR
jgi:hypothetical protein